MKLISIFFLFVAVGVVGAETYSNPVTTPGSDPTILKDGDTYYLYCTADNWLGDVGIPVYKSKDMVNWAGPCGAGPNGLALHKDDVWGDKWFWAPDVVEKDGIFYMYATTEKRMIVAVSDSPLGPFTQVVQEPIRDAGVEIDAGVLADDDGKYYIYFSREDSAGQHILVAELSEDMLTMKEETITFCLSSDPGTWESLEGDIVEAPFCMKRNGTYYLTYSANSYASIDYAIGYATSSSPFGPWTKYGGNPIIHRTSEIYGTGHGMFTHTVDGSEMYAVYHAHPGLTGIGPRKIMLDRAWFQDNGANPDILVVNGPTVTPQPCPSGTPTWYGTSLITGQDDGRMGLIEHEGSYFSAGSLDDANLGVVDMAVVGGGMHVVSAGGIAYYDYDPATGMFSKGGSYAFPDATGVAVALDGTIYTSRNNGGGLNQWTYSGGTYTAGGWVAFDALDVGVDSKGNIHVAEAGGLSTWRFTGSEFVQDAFLGGAYFGGSTILVGDDDVVRYGKYDGVNSLVYDEVGHSYTDIGFSLTDAPVTDIEIGSGLMWISHTNGIHLYDADTPTVYLGHYFDDLYTISDICIDSDGTVHASKLNGLAEFIYAPGVVEANIIAGDFFYQAEGMTVIAAGAGSFLVSGQDGGLGLIRYEESYFPAGFINDTNSGVVGMAVVGDGMHVVSSTGLTYYDYDQETDTFAKGGNHAFPGATAVVTSPDGTIFTTQSGGLNSWIYSGGTYQETGFIAFAGARDLAIDPASEVIHVLHNGGLSAFTYSGGILSAITGAWQPDVLNGNSIVIDSSGTVFAGRDSGINALTFDGATYSLGGWWGAANASDLALASDGTLFATRTSGWDMDSLTYNGTTFTQTGYLGGLNGGAFKVFVDSEDHIHVVKADGILEVVYDDTLPIVGALAVGDWFGNNGGISEIVEGITPLLPPPLSIFWIDANLLYWSSDNGVVYAIYSKTNLLSGIWLPLETGIEATPPVNSFPLPLDDFEGIFFRLKATR